VRKYHYCDVCNRPGTRHCGPCTALRRFLAALHRSARPEDDRAAKPVREARIARYRSRAAARLPLFAEAP
jgi:hypothetical protein